MVVVLWAGRLGRLLTMATPLVTNCCRCCVVGGPTLLKGGKGGGRVAF